MTLHKFTKDYYEDGIRKGISGYEDYHWMPTRSIPEAITIQDNFTFKTCIDFGCAKGFLVHALRLLGCEAFGEDISEYAIANCHEKVKPFLEGPTNKKYDLLIAKDILEHIEEVDLPNLLEKFLNRADTFFFVIPLGDNDRFRIREYEVDVTHVTKKDEEWWIELFNNCGFSLKSFSYTFEDMKENWVKEHPYGNGFFVLEKNDI